MKYTYYTAIFISLILILIINCREQASSFHKSVAPAPLNTTAQKTINYDSLMDLLCIYQGNIVLEKKNSLHMKKLLTISFDTVSGCFLVVGKGVYNTSLPMAAQNESRKLASKISGERWALYEKAWYNSTYIPFGKPLTGKILYSKVLGTQIINDTLFTLNQVPLGSIVLE